MQKKITSLGLLLVALLVLSMALPSQAAVWTVGRDAAKFDFTSIQDAIDDPAVQPGDTLQVTGGQMAGARITKSGLTIEGKVDATSGNLVTAIQANSVGPYGFLFDGTFFNDPSVPDVTSVVIKNVKFATGLKYPVYSLGADNITVDNCSMVNPIQGITNWSGREWKISNNKINGFHPDYDNATSDNKTVGGGIGILCGVREMDPAMGAIPRAAALNVVKFNTITGDMKVRIATNGEYSVAAIALVDNGTDRRCSRNTIEDNTIGIKNAGLTDPTAYLVKSYGILLNEIETVAQPADSVNPNIENNKIQRNLFTGDGMLIDDMLGQRPLLPAESNNIYPASKANANVTDTGFALSAPLVPSDFDVVPF